MHTFRHNACPGTSHSIWMASIVQRVDNAIHWEKTILWIISVSDFDSVPPLDLALSIPTATEVCLFGSTNEQTFI